MSCSRKGIAKGHTLKENVEFPNQNVRKVKTDFNSDLRSDTRVYQKTGVMTGQGILGVKTWRRQKGISLESISAATKLSIRQLDAIENGDFDRLPGGIYDTSYIKQYAQAIEFDEANLLAFYRNASGSRAPYAKA
jgi:hypothetical protein